MNDQPSRLEMLRFLERVQQQDLERTRRWIAAAQQREAQRQRAIQARPPAPDRLIEQSLSRDVPAAYVHRGDCHMAGKRSRGVARDQALRALTDGIAPCPHCLPDTELGILD
ncbi:DUF6233 domain-containing protein [Streptomyces sp. NPDC000851]